MSKDLSGKTIENSDDFHRRINPCRVPPGYRLLAPEEIVEANDIYWHTADFIWRRLPYPPKNFIPQKTYGIPYARPVDAKVS